MSNQQNLKKMRQLFRREIRAYLHKLTEGVFNAGEMFKPKPKFMPLFIFEKLKKLVVNESFKLNYEKFTKNLEKQKRELEGE